MSLRTPALFATALAVGLAASTAAAQTAQPRYFAQIQAELQAMGLAPQCAATNGQTGTCTVHAAAPAAPGATAPATPRRFLVNLTYDDNTDTIYIYADHYASIRADAPDAGNIFRRLLEMNWEMLIGRFEWSAGSGEIRLSTVLSTDSNFDRRAFRGVVRSLLRLADRYALEVSRMTGRPVGEAPADATTPPPAGSAQPPGGPAPRDH